jgi:hypothetical protein
MIKDTTITHIDDARDLKRMNLPLNTRVETREVSHAYSEHWMALMNAQERFMLAMYEYLSEGSRRAKWRQVKQKVNSLHQASERCAAFCTKLGANASPPSFKSQRDEHEHAILAYFLTERAGPFIEYWKEMIAAADAGDEVTIDPDDIPPWTDDDGVR